VSEKSDNSATPRPAFKDYGAAGKTGRRQIAQFQNWDSAIPRVGHFFQAREDAQKISHFL
jgi:hypothetical protein